MKTYANYRTWKGWTEGFTTSAREASVFRQELRGLPLAGTNLLELGFGAGRFLAWARAQGATVTGTEMQPELVQWANTAGFDAHLADEAPWQRWSGQFHTVVAFDVLEHFAPDDLPTLFARIHNALVPGGHLLARFPNAASPFSGFYQYADWTHLSALSVDRLRQMLTDTDWEIRRARPPRYPWVGKGLGASVVYATRKLVVPPVRRVLEYGIGVLFLDRIEYLAPNIVVLLRRPG